jgi:16S rRNA U516 pseudouridylate synthase RsuA-like enzyme
LRIIRISIGDIHLQNLKSGEVQEIAENDFLRKLNLETIQNDEQEEKRIR